MVKKAGVQIKKNSKGEITHITIDVRKHKEALPFLNKIGVIEDDFEKDWNSSDYLTVEEAKAQTLEFISKLPWKKS